MKQPRRLKKKESEQLSSPSVVETQNNTETVSKLQDPTQDRKVIFRPNDGPQTDFLAASEREVLYGGSAGGGKSYAMLADPLRYITHPQFSGLLIRHTTEELRELVWKSQELYPKAIPNIKWSERKMQWVSPQGGRLWFSYLDRDDDVLRYQGLAFSWIGFDELTQWATPFAWNYLRSRLRTSASDLPIAMRATTNPGGAGHQWVKKMFIDPAPANQSFWATDIDNGQVLRYPNGHTREGEPLFRRKFIPARLFDNPYLAESGDYETMLLSLPEHQRKQLLEGNWDVAEGAAFVEFDPTTHVIEPFSLPMGWERVKAIDYGYASESCCLWGILDINDKTLIIYRELYRKGLTGEELGSIITEMEMDDPFSVNGVLDTSAWAKTGTTGPTVGEALVKQGHKLRRADKNRIQGKIQVHEYLKIKDSGRPKLQIFNTCPNLIRELQSIPLSKTNPEDVDTNASDHAYDALRYMIMSRPRIQSPFDRIRNLKKEQLYKPSDSEFGY